MNKEKVKRIQVPVKQLIDREFPTMALYLYMHLKGVCFKNEVNIYSTTLLKKLEWKSQKTLKKYLLVLKDHNLISFDFDDFPIHKPLHIKIREFIKKNKQKNIKQELFVQVDINTINKIIECAKYTKVALYLTKAQKEKKEKKQYIKKKGTNKNTTEDLKYRIVNTKEMALRLFYYYEMKYDESQNKAYPNYDEINKDTGISNQYIKAINTMFKNNNLVDVKVGRVYEEINDYGEVIKKKERNNYTPLCNRKYTLG